MRYILSLILSINLINVSAQEIISKIYFDKKNEQVEIIDSAYYLREITAKDTSRLYKIKEYYLSGKLKLEGQLLNYNPSIIYQGIIRKFYESGIIEAEENYLRGQKIGDNKNFYQNGNLKEHLFYVYNAVKKPGDDVPSYTTVQFADSLGKTYLDDKGNGIVAPKIPNSTEEYGEYIDGLKNGLWITKNLKNGENYEDTYKNGKYIEGKTLKSDGTIITYKSLEKLPEFSGGVSAFGRFLAQNLRYPPDARIKGTQGRVFLGFVVEPDGSLSDLKVVKGVSYDLDKEAHRVLSLSPKWEPGMKRGIPVRNEYSVPIFFQLGFK